jgi:hypothetical protein
VRRGLGRGRALTGVGAVLALVGVWLPWYTVGGEVLPALTANGFDGAGVLVFLAAVGMLGLLALPYTSRTHSSALDRPAVFAVLVLVGIIGLAIEAWTQLTAQPESRLGGPLDAPGLWLAALGIVLAAWGTAEAAAERPPPL